MSVNRSIKRILIAFFLILLSSAVFPEYPRSFASSSELAFSTLPLSSFPSSPQPPFNFTSEDYFSLPDCNGTINFAGEGTYNYAYKLKDNFTYWVFIALAFENETSGENFGISAQNCNATITNISTTVVAENKWGRWLNYSVAGNGSQSFSGGYSEPQTLSELDVYVDGTLKNDGEDWNISNGWLTITGAKQEASIYSVFSLPPRLPPPSNVPPPSSRIPDSIVFSLVVVAIIATVVSAVILVRRKKAVA